MIITTRSVALSIGLMFAATTTHALEAPECPEVLVDTMQNSAMDYIDGLTAASSEVYKDMDNSFGEMSCLEKLMDGGADIFFKPPSIGDISGQIKDAACTAAEDMIAKATEPLNQQISESLNIGEIVPGLDLGSISGKAGVRWNKNGGTGDSPFTINGQAPSEGFNSIGQGINKDIQSNVRSVREIRNGINSLSADDAYVMFGGE